MPCTGAKTKFLRLVQGNICERGSMYYVYVLLSEKDKNFYIGFTEDVEQRLDEHNAGKNVSTRSRRPFISTKPPFIVVSKPRKGAPNYFLTP